MIHDIQHILFVELLGGIGDVVIAIPAIHALARSHPQAQITVLTFAPGGTLLESDPLIHQVVYADRKSPRHSLDKLLFQNSFDLIVSDTNYDGMAEAIAQSGAKYTLTNLWQSPPSDERVGDRFLKLLHKQDLIASDEVSSEYPYIHLTTNERNQAKQFLGATFRPLIVLIPDAGMTIKQWAIPHFMTLGNLLIQQYQATILIPEGSDRESAIALANGMVQYAQVLPPKDLRSLAAILELADLVVAADTGLARIAAAFNTPTITLFGPSWYGRYGQPEPHINLQGFPECPERLIHNFTEQACWYSGECPYEWRSCLDNITPEVVFEAATRLLETMGKEQESGVRLPRASADRSQKSEEKFNSLRSEGAIVGAGLSTDNTGKQTILETRPPLQTKEPITRADLPSGNFAKQTASTTRLAPEWAAVRNLLVMRLDNIGDVMMTSPALRSLKENLPDAKITLMASPSGALTAPLMPGVDEVLPWRTLWQDLGRLDFSPDREWELIDTIQQRQFDAAIVFTSFAQSPHPAALICALAGIPLRLGASKERDWSLTHAISPAPDTLHQVERNIRLIEEIGFQVSDRRLSLNIPPLTLPLPTSYLLLNPWTSCQSRNYDPERFAHAARQLSDKTGYPVVVTGVEKDRDRSSHLFEILGESAIDLMGKTNLSELVALVADAKLLLTNNTSTMHIADATRTPNVVLFAGTEQECQWQPRHSPSRLLRRPTVCSPCYAFTCPYELQCLDISVETVVEAALDLINSRS